MSPKRSMDTLHVHSFQGSILRGGASVDAFLQQVQTRGSRHSTLGLLKRLKNDQVTRSFRNWPIFRISGYFLERRIRQHQLHLLAHPGLWEYFKVTGLHF